MSSGGAERFTHAIAQRSEEMLAKDGDVFIAQSFRRNTPVRIAIETLPTPPALESTATEMHAMLTKHRCSVFRVGETPIVRLHCIRARILVQESFVRAEL